MNHVDLRKTTAQNYKVLESTPDGGDIMYASLQQIVLFGVDHDPAVMGIVNDAGNRSSYGSITVTKRRGAGKGTLKVDHFRGNQAERKHFIAGIRLFSDMEVVFV